MSCSVALDPDRVQCETDADCTARGDAFAGTICGEDSLCHPEPRWSCLDAPPPPTPMTGTFRVTFAMQHIITQMPLPGIAARLCRRIDVNCENPISEIITTDESGQASFEVEAGFDGYARFTSSSTAPGLFFFDPPVRSDLPSITVSMASSEVVALLAQQAGTSQDPNRGTVLLVARDCTGTPAVGVQFTPTVSDPTSAAFYSEQGLPSGTASQTDVAGYGGLLNVEAGSITLIGTIAATRRQFAQVTLLVQPGSITYGTLVPEGT